MMYIPIQEIQVFPAYAGVILNTYDKNGNWIGLSRVCGGDPASLFSDFFFDMSFPRMRG